MTDRTQDAPIGVEAWQQAFSRCGYVATIEIVQMVELAFRMHRPLLIEGPAGAGKTSLAISLANVLARELVRLQCFEGMDATHALYDWNAHKQFAALTRRGESDVFDESYLLERPLMRALRSERGAVLLIDEVDRADEALEALLLEYLGEFQVTVPEWTTVTARVQPVTILTSNRTRALSDALRRRCLYLHLPYPDETQELRVVQTWVKEISDADALRLVRAVQYMRTWPLAKVPGMAETRDWCQAWTLTHGSWSAQWVQATLGCVVKDQNDLLWVSERIEELLSGFT